MILILVEMLFNQKALPNRMMSLISNLEEKVLNKRLKINQQLVAI
jgi:hypothetical protein